MTRKVHHLALLLILAFASATSVVAGMYRWTDDQGNVVYSQQPPPDDREHKSIAPPPPPAEPVENSLEKSRELNEKLDAMAEERAKAREKQLRDKAEKKKRDARCESAKKNLKTLTERPPNTLYKTPDNEWKRFTPEEFTEQVKNLKKTIKENCK
ncbi:DUF4124 domain-containing protein [Thiolapillus sp.]